MKTSTNIRRWSTEEVERCLRDRVKVLEQYIGTFRGGQIHIVQPPGAGAVRILGEVEEAHVEGQTCIIRVSGARQCSVAFGPPWRRLVTYDVLRLDIRAMGELQWGSSRVSFTYSDNGELGRLNDCRVELRLQDDPVDPWR